MIEDYVKIFPQDENNTALLMASHPATWKNPDPLDVYDVAVIGCGPAGFAAAVESVRIGAKTAVIERGFVGGSYLVNGGIPIQCLARSVRNIGEMTRAPRYGVILSANIKTDFSAAMERMRYLRSQAAERYSIHLLAKMGVDVFLGEAVFTGKNSLEVNSKPIQFRKAIIATGASGAFPVVDGLKEANPLTYSTIFNITAVPKRTAIIGGGFAACEIAQLFCRFGSKVTMILRSGVLSREDAEVSSFVSEMLTKEGITMLSGRLRRVHSEHADKVLIVDVTNGQKRIEVDEIIVATGVAPGITGMGLEFAGVEYDKKIGIKTNFMLRTTNRNIYAAGDVCSEEKFGSVAEYMGTIAARNALIPFWIEKGKNMVSWSLNTDPPIARIGLTEKQAAEKDMETETVAIGFSEIDRALVDGDEEGFIMVRTNKKNNIIVGAVIAGNAATEISALFSFAIKHKQKLRNLHKIITASSAYVAGARKLARKAQPGKVEQFFKEIAEAWLRVQRGGKKGNDTANNGQTN